MRLKQLILKTPVLGILLGKGYASLTTLFFRSSSDYWESRYKKGGNSGDGSYRHLAVYKANFLNKLVRENDITSVIEFGCGDGNQLRLAEYPSYLGVDVSETAVKKCITIFQNDPTKAFTLLEDYDNRQAELALSLDVIYHLVEDKIFEAHMNNLFNSATKLVVIYSSNQNKQGNIQLPHVKHRLFTDWIKNNQKDWELFHQENNPYPLSDNFEAGSFANFFVFKKTPEYLKADR